MYEHCWCDPVASILQAAQPAAATGAYLKQLGKPEKYLQPVGFHAGASSLPPGYPATSQAATYAPAAGAACGPAVASHPAATAAGNAAAAASAGYAAAVPASAGYAMQPAGAAVQQQQLQPQHMAQRPAAQLQQQYLPPPQQAARPQQQAAPQQCHQWQLQQQHQQQQQPQQQAQQTQQPGPTAPSTGVPADSRKRPYEGADQVSFMERHCRTMRLADCRNSSRTAWQATIWNCACGGTADLLLWR